MLIYSDIVCKRYQPTGGTETRTSRRSRMEPPKSTLIREPPSETPPPAVKSIDDWLGSPAPSSKPATSNEAPRTITRRGSPADHLEEMVALQLKQREMLTKKVLEEQEKQLGQLVEQGKQLMKDEMAKSAQMFHVSPPILSLFYNCNTRFNFAIGAQRKAGTVSS